MLCLGIGSRPSKRQNPVSLLMFLHPKSRAHASCNSAVSHCSLVSLALCFHLCTFIFQPRCSIRFSFPSDYFHLSLCLNKVIHIFNANLKLLFYAHVVPSTDLLSLLFPPGQLLIHSHHLQFPLFSH